jgi:hypothetical protein
MNLILVKSLCLSMLMRTASTVDEARVSSGERMRFEKLVWIWQARTKTFQTRFPCGSGDACTLQTYEIPEDGYRRPALFCFYTRVCRALLTSLKEAGHRDWFVGSVGKQIATNLKWLKDPTNSKNINIDPDRIAMIGYSIGGIRAGAAAKVEPVRGMIYLNSGNRNFRKAKKPFADYLIITGLEQKAGWVDGNARLKGEIKNAGAYVQKLDLPGVGHVNWRKENKLVIDTITAFLVDRVQKKGEGQVEPLCSTTCEGRFVKCCEVRQASGMKSNEAFELCSSSIRRGGDYW